MRPKEVADHFQRPYSFDFFRSQRRPSFFLTCCCFCVSRRLFQALLAACVLDCRLRIHACRLPRFVNTRYRIADLSRSNFVASTYYFLALLACPDYLTLSDTSVRVPSSRVNAWLSGHRDLTVSSEGVTRTCAPDKVRLLRPTSSSMSSVDTAAHRHALGSFKALATVSQTLAV